MRIAHPRTFAGLLVAAGLALSGCSRDPGPELLQKADQRYQELISQGTLTQDAAWNDVVTQLEAIPKDSKSRPEAERRLAALKAAQAKPPPRPLARPGSTGTGASDVEVKRAACEALAKKLGQTQADAMREPLKKALEACQVELVRLEATDHPPGEGVHEGH
jgi:hypothetical protein